MGVRRMRGGDRAQVATWKEFLRTGDDGDAHDETGWVWESADGSVGGFVSVRPWAQGRTTTPMPYVEGWFVREDLRRAGIGRALIEAAEQWARSAGFSEIGSVVRLDDAASLRAHHRVGFQPTERLQFFRKSLDGGQVGADFINTVRVEWHTGSRAPLRPLFELAEDSPAELDSYLDSGRVLVAIAGDEVVGQLQLVDTDHPGEAEIKNMAVREDHHNRGIGGRLVRAAIAVLAHESVSILRVATATAGIDNLRFYQRQGFRMRSIQRDAFTTATGYPPGIRVDDIELRDRVWLDLSLTDTHSGPARDCR